MQKKEAKRANYGKQKVDTYISYSDLSRLRNICAKYKFKSIYQLLQYLIHCFLRVADPENDPIDEPVPVEIEEMFTNNAEWEMHKSAKGSHSGMVIRQKPDQRKIKSPDDLKL